MQTLQNDTATYSVVSRVNGKMVYSHFETFALAAGHASGLNGVRFINVKFSNGDSSWSGSLYAYDKNGFRRACNKALIAAVSKRGGR